MANILRDRGYLVTGDNEDEFEVIRGGDSPSYFVDIAASNNERVIIVEIDGYKGHKSRRAIFKDLYRATEIKAMVKYAEFYRFAFWQLKGTSSEVIAEELKLT